MIPKMIEIQSIKKLKKHAMYEMATNVESINISEDFMVIHELYKGKQITEDEYKKIKKDLQKEESFLKVCNYISYQMRSEQEVKIYLKGLNCTLSEIDKIVKRLSSLGYIDDELLANSLLSSAINHLKGPRYWQDKIFTRRIKREAINNITYDFETEKETIERAIEKNRNKNDNLPKAKQKESLASKLLRDGFTSSLVFSCLQEKEKEGFFHEDTEENILRDIKKMMKKYQKYESYEQKKKVIAALISRGYEYSMINKYLNFSDE